MKIWLDDIRCAPIGFVHCHSVNEAIAAIEQGEKTETIELIDCDHDLGDYAYDGGDGIKLLDWLLERGTRYPVKLHTMNPVGRDNMQRMLNRYWEENSNHNTVESSSKPELNRTEARSNQSNDTLLRSSRFLCLVLRHKPEAAEITLDAHGWADVSELLCGLASRYPLTMEELEEIVRTDDKQRYSFNEDKTKIRANQGHSVPVDVELTECAPPDSLPDEPFDDPPKQPELPPAAVETPGKEEGDLLDGFFTVPAQEPDAKQIPLQNWVPERSMEQIRELLLEAANNRGANIRRCAEMLLGYFNQGKQFFTRKEIAEDCGFDPSQTSDMITQFRSKGIIRKEEAPNRKQGLYCFNVRESALLQNSDPHSAEHTEGQSPIDSFPTVSVQESDEPAPASDNRITETNMDYIRELLIKCKESYGERLKKCSILLLDFLDQGKYTFTQADIAAGCDLESKQSANMILHLRSKGIIESCRKWEGSYMLYRFRTDQSSPVLQCTDHVAEKDDLLDDPGDAAQAQHAKISLRRVRNKLYDLTESSGSVFRVGARHLLNLMDAGMETFTIDDFLETPYISGKRLNNFITHMKAKSLIESCGEREENRHMAYRFSTSMPPLTEDDYDPDLLEIVRQLRESSGSQKDRRIGCALFANLPQGIIMSQDYPDYKDTAKMASDMSLAEQMGLVTKIKPYVYRINRQRSYLLPSLSRTQTAVLSQTFECFGNSWFSLQDAYDTLALKRTKICATIHQLVQLNITECQEGKRNTYRLLVNPTDYPALFGRKADGQETEKSGLELITQASKTEQQSLYEMPYSDEYYAMLDALEQSADTPDRRLAQVLRQCLDKGYVVRDDYLQQGYTENQWGKDMEMALALGLVRSGGRGKRTLNRTVDFARDELRPHLKRAISAIYETFGDHIFSCEMFTATLNYSTSRTYASLHNLALLKVVDQTDTEYGRQYRLLVNPADNPEWFDAA